MDRNADTLRHVSSSEAEIFLVVGRNLATVMTIAHISKSIKGAQRGSEPREFFTIEIFHIVFGEDTATD